MIHNFEALIQALQSKPKKTIAVAAAQDEDVLLSVAQAVSLRLAEVVLVGDKTAILNHCKVLSIDAGIFCIHHEEDKLKAAQIAVRMASGGDAHIIMKGMLGTADILRAVLNKDWGLRKEELLSHATLFEAPERDRMMLMTDAAMNIAPTLLQKVELIRNAAGVAEALGIKNPKVAAIAAVELVNPQMQATLDGALLTQMAARGQIRGVILDGPLGLDNAISMQAAQHKGIGGPVAGQADILLMPNIETGNVFYKTLAFFSQTKMAGVVLGAKVPVVLTSRADTPETKLHSIALACYLGG